MNIKSISIGIIWLILPVSLNAQSTIAAAGASASSASGSVSWTIGQVAFAGASGMNGAVQEGVQQVYTLSQVHVPESLSDIQLSIFPNPTRHSLSIQIPENETDFIAIIHDSKGAVIQQLSLLPGTTNVEVSQWPQAMYFIEIQDAYKRLARYQLIKN